jgi:hypothetical protein
VVNVSYRFPASELNDRTDAIRAVFELCGASRLEGTALTIALQGTQWMTLAQLQLGCSRTAAERDKTRPILTQIKSYADRESRKQDTGAKLFVVPFILGAKPEDVERFRQPAGYQWQPDELAAIYAMLNLEAPDSVARSCAAKVAEPLDVERFGLPPDPNDHSEPRGERRRELFAQQREHLRRLGARHGV